jgi:hypothetical protein
LKGHSSTLLLVHALETEDVEYFDNILSAKNFAHSASNGIVYQEGCIGALLDGLDDAKIKMQLATDLLRDPSA